MGNKINRIGMARHTLEVEATTNIATSALATGSTVSQQNSSAQIVNPTALQGQGSSHCNTSASGSHATGVVSGWAQQILVDVPAANTVLIEVWGEYLGFFNTGCIMAPFIGSIDTAATVAGELKTIIKPTRLRSYEAIASGYFSQNYHHIVALNGTFPRHFVHGFQQINPTGAGVTQQMYQSRFGFRTLDNELRYYDPVR